MVEKSRKQLNYLMIGLGVFLIILAIITGLSSSRSGVWYEQQTTKKEIAQPNCDQIPGCLCKERALWIFTCLKCDCYSEQSVPHYYSYIDFPSLLVAFFLFIIGLILILKFKW